MTVACVGVTRSGRRLAADLAAHLGGKVADRVEDAWPHAEQVVLVMATGIAVRRVAPLLADKRGDPGVVVVDEAARFAVALTGGHEGGANALAARVAAHLGATPVVTTATEARGLSVIGERAEGDVPAVLGALVAGDEVHVHRELAWPLPPLPAAEVAHPGATPLVWVTDRLVEAPGPCVLWRPPSLVVGVGASRGAPADEVGGLIDGALVAAGLSPRAVHCVATVAAKADEAGILAAAAARGWPVVTLPAEQLAAVAVPNPSPVVAAAVGTPSVAEAAALHLGGELLVAKRRSAHATVAVARRPGRGRLTLVGLGPGDPDLLPPRARDALAAAEVVVGYESYLDQARPHTRRGARLEGSPLGDETARARHALALAAERRAVALVSSGDAGVYGMASPTLELAADDLPVDVEVVPGISAMHAAAALLGAPLGHDHCAISLSDLLTPWEAIARRLRAAADADLVVALYNPRSRGRDWQLDQAVAILREHRPDTTPVGLVRDAFRPDQQVTVATLGALDTVGVDMRTLVVVGSSRTRLVAGRMVTPRGYPPEVAP